MNIQIVNLVNLSGLFLCLFALAEVMYHKLKCNAEITRKIVHIFSGLITMLFPLVFHSVIPVLILCGSFLLLLIISQEFNLLPSINNIDRVSKGSFYFPIAIAVSFFMSWKLASPILYYLPLMIMVLADPFACLVGKRFPFGKFKVGDSNKTLMGSMGFFALSFIISLGLLFQIGKMDSYTLVFNAFILALGTCLAEAFSSKGYDNITIPVTASLILLVL